MPYVNYLQVVIISKIKKTLLSSHLIYPKRRRLSAVHWGWNQENQPRTQLALTSNLFLSMHQLYSENLLVPRLTVKKYCSKIHEMARLRLQSLCTALKY